jgi:hypothetical protein
VAIQDAMGWEDCHLNEFTCDHPITGKTIHIGIPDEDGDAEELLPEWEIPLQEYFIETHDNSLATAWYDYDFGDGWRHKLQFEKVLPRNPARKYPQCLEGRRSCPPEDCGGAWGYKHLLTVISDSDHPEYADLITWVGKEFDPEEFSVAKIQFSDPHQRLALWRDSKKVRH